MVAGGAVSKVDPDSAAVNPAWRKAGGHALNGVGWPDGTSAEAISKLLDISKTGTAKLRALAPESGAYLNEVRPFSHHGEHPIRLADTNAPGFTVRARLGALILWSSLRTVAGDQGNLRPPRPLHRC